MVKTEFERFKTIDLTTRPPKEYQQNKQNSQYENGNY